MHFFRILASVAFLSSPAGARGDALRPKVLAEGVVKEDPSVPASVAKASFHFEFAAEHIRDCRFDVERLDQKGNWQKHESDVKSDVVAATRQRKAKGEAKTAGPGSYRVKAKFRIDGIESERASDWKAFIVNKAGKLTSG